MTSPGPDDFTRRLTTAAAVTGGNRPQLAVSLAKSDLSHTEIRAVGGFTDALSLSVARQLAGESGAQTNFSATEKNQLNGIGEQLAPEDAQPDSRTFFEKATDWVAGAVSNTGNFLLHNPVSHGLFVGLEKIGDAAHMPFRLLADGLDTNNNDEIAREMQAQGYDPTSTASYFWFMLNKGESQYHDLSAARDHFGEENVDLAIQMQADPEQFQRDFEKMTPEAAAELQARMQSREFQDAADAVDRQHISPGRDIARLLTLGHTNNGFFTALSGSLDAAYDWFTDPTLILGKANKIIKAADVLGRDASPLEKILTAIPGQANRRAGLIRGENSMIDQAGVDALMATDANGNAVTAVGKGWQRYLADSADHRAAVAAGDENKAAGIFAAMQKRYGVLMDMFPEINGQRLIPDTGDAAKAAVDGITTTHLVTHGKPITEMSDLADYLASKGGLLRLKTGMAAREAVVMPGRLSWWAERKAAADTRTARSTEKWINYADKNGKFIPNEAEQQLLDEAQDPEAVRAGLAQAALMRKSGFLHARAARARVERVARRFATQIPNTERLDLNAPGSALVVQNIARMYLNRGDAAKLASAYAAAPDLATRRAVVRGALVQSFHASGLSRSEAGRNFMERFVGDQSMLEKQQYGFDKTSEILTDRGPVQVAMYPDQISSTVLLPSMRKMHFLATKFAVGGFAGRTGLANITGLAQAPGMDALMGMIKLGWIATAAGGLRNAIDEVANFAAYGISKDVLRGRAVFTQATKDARAERLAASKQRRQMLRDYGAQETNDRISSMLDAGLKSHGDATLAVEKATPEELPAAQAQLASAKAELKRAQLLQHAISHRIPYAFRYAADNLNDIFVGTALGKAMSVFGKEWKITPQHVKYAQELVNREAGITLSDGLFQAHHADTELLHGTDSQAMDYHRAGAMARKYSFRSTGWGHVEADGGAGLDALAKTLQLRFADTNSPAHAWAQTVHALLRPEGVGKHGTVADLEATGEELLHGTARKFDTFEANPTNANWDASKRINEGIYFTDDPKVARDFADNFSVGAWERFLPETHWKYAVESAKRDGVSDATAAALRAANESGDEAAIRAARADFMEETLAARLRAGGAVSFRNGEHELVRVTDPDKLESEIAKLGDRTTVLNDHANIAMVNPGYDPRTVRAKVYGRTLDLRNHDAIPDDLRASLEAEGVYRPWDREQTASMRGGNAHEGSQALIDYMRANGYGKAHVHDLDFDSYIALPEMIKHGANDPVAAYKAATGPMSRDEWANVLDAARESLLKRLDDPELRHFVASSENFQWYKGTKIAKDDGVTRQFAKEDYADRASADLVRALGGGEGDAQISKPLLDELVAGRVPSRVELAQMPADQRPKQAIGQSWGIYNPAAAPGQINRGYTGLMSKVYGKVVTDQIDAISRNPLVTALYMQARANTEGYVKHLVANGWDQHVADDIGRRIAAQHAEVEAFKHIDNPYISSQFSMLSRNYFAFVRAQEDWLRRWGRTIKDNPEIIRKAQLLIHGGESTGFLEQDDQGEVHFVYPGSNLLLGIFGSLFGLVDQPNAARIPVQGELSSQLQFINPSLDNPLGLSGTPLLSLPWKAIAHFMGPDHKLMTSSIDSVINGQLGAGRQWWEQMLPSWANRIIGGVLPTEDMGSKYGAAIQSTLANMEAAGMLNDPQYQTPEGKAKLLHALQVGTHNDLLSTVLFGFLLPAAPTYEGTARTTADGFQGTTADWSAHKEGLRSLKDEARQVFARLPYDQAKAWWMKVHPNESILAPTGAGSRSTVGANAANAPATIAAASYLQKHTDFFGNYGGKGGVAAYFIPQGRPGTTNGSYSDVAYRAQLELGIRDYKSLSDYFDDVITARGFSQYFAEKDAYDAAKLDAGGSASLNADADAQWQDTRDLILKANPLLAARLAGSAVDNAQTGATIQSLYKMVADSSPSTVAALGPNRAGVAAMLEAKAQYDEGNAALNNRRGAAANRARNDLKTTYDAQINQLAAHFPGLADLARGVFRPTS